MTVLTVKEVINRGGTLRGFHESSSRNWLITVDSRYENQRTIYNQTAGTSLPIIFQSHPSNIFATCRSLTIDHYQGFVWKAKADYSTEPLTQSERERAEDPVPVNRRVKVSWSAANYDKVIVKDKDDNAVINSAGDYYDPPPSVPWDRLTFHFRKNYASPSPWISSYCNSVNVSPISILGIAIPAGMARFTQPSGSEEREENGQIFHETTWNIEVDNKTWQLEVLDEGLRYLDPDDATKRINAVDDDGNEVSSPILLNGSGAKLDNPTISNAVYNEHKVYSELDYTFLPGVDAGTGV